MKEERYRMYEEHVNHFRSSIELDIKSWRDLLGQIHSPQRITFHLGQFDQFYKSAYGYLTVDSPKSGRWESFDPKSPWEAENDRIKFKAEVIGVLTHQWTWFKEVLVQLSTNHPCHKKRSEGDDFVKLHYHRLYQAIPDGVRKRLTPSSPLVFIGNFAALTRFKRQAPSILCVPLEIEEGVSVEKSRLTPKIFHEIGHAIFDQLPGILQELDGLVMTYRYPKSVILKNLEKHRV